MNGQGFCQPLHRERAGTDERYRSTQHAIDAAAQAADVAPNGKSTSGCPKAAADRGAAKKHTRWARRARRREDKR